MEVPFQGLEKNRLDGIAQHFQLVIIFFNRFSYLTRGFFLLSGQLTIDSGSFAHFANVTERNILFKYTWLDWIGKFWKIKTFMKKRRENWHLILTSNLHVWTWIWTWRKIFWNRSYYLQIVFNSILQRTIKVHRYLTIAKYVCDPLISWWMTVAFLNHGLCKSESYLWSECACTVHLCISIIIFHLQRALSGHNSFSAICNVTLWDIFCLITFWSSC